MLKHLFITSVLLAAFTITHPAESAEAFYKGSALKKLLRGKTIRLSTGGKIQYKRSGGYLFSNNRGKFKGKYRFTSTHVCVDFANGRKRCDRFVNDGGVTYFQNNSGGRYKVRSIR